MSSTEFTSGQCHRAIAALLMLIACVAAAPTSGPSKLPEPPAGFTWFTSDLAKISLLVPNGWHTLQEGKDDTTAAFVTKEPIKDGQMFSTGLSVNVIRGRKDIDAPAYAQGMIEQMQKKGESRGSKKITRHGLDGAECTVVIAGPDGKFVTYVAALASPKTNTLCILQFESPEANWDAEWKKGKVLTEQFVLHEK